MTPDTARTQGFRLSIAGTLFRDDGPEFEECITRLHTADNEGEKIVLITVTAETRERAKTMAKHWAKVFQVSAQYQGRDFPKSVRKISPPKP